MIELAHMADSQVEQLEKPTYSREQTITLRPDVARPLGHVLEQMFAEPIRKTGVVLENSKALPLETNPLLRDFIEDFKPSLAAVKEVFTGLKESKKVKMKTSIGGGRFEFIGHAEGPIEPGEIAIPKDLTQKITATLTHLIKTPLTLIQIGAESINRHSESAGVRQDAKDVTLVSSKIAEKAKQLAGVSEMKLKTDAHGNTTIEFTRNKSELRVSEDRITPGEAKASKSSS